MLGDELRLEPVARVAVVMPAVYFIAGLIVLRVKAAEWRVLGHQLHVIWDDTRAGITPPAYNTPDVFSPDTLVVGIVTVAAVGDRLHLAAPGRVGGPRPRVPGRPVAGLGRRLLVRADRQPLDALRRHP